MKFILGKKIKMTTFFNEKGFPIPVTLITCGPCFVTQIKTKEKDGYEAIQIGYENLKPKKIKKSQKTKPFKYLREFKNDISKFKVGDKIDVSIFKEGEEVKISGVSKGKGFAGGVKRWGFRGRPKTRGTKHEERQIGSIGASTPPRVIKGKKMPGRMGSKRVTIKNLEIIKIDKENNLIMVKGAVPGIKGSLLEIKV